MAGRGGGIFGRRDGLGRRLRGRAYGGGAPEAALHYAQQALPATPQAPTKRARLADAPIVADCAAFFIIRLVLLRAVISRGAGAYHVVSR